jgi:hypothetical protein
MRISKECQGPWAKGQRSGLLLRREEHYSPYEPVLQHLVHCELVQWVCRGEVVLDISSCDEVHLSGS